jgi:hypothetical protein
MRYDDDDDDDDDDDAMLAKSTHGTETVLMANTRTGLKPAGKKRAGKESCTIRNCGARKP